MEKEDISHIKGGNDGWYKPKTNEINRTPGDSCGALCDPLNNLPTGTLQITVYYSHLSSIHRISFSESSSIRVQRRAEGFRGRKISIQMWKWIQIS